MHTTVNGKKEIQKRLKRLKNAIGRSEWNDKFNLERGIIMKFPKKIISELASYIDAKDVQEFATKNSQPIKEEEEFEEKGEEEK